MTFSELMGILNGEYKETAGTDAKNQCVDLANAYIKYVLGLPIIEWTNAVDFPSKARDNYDYILNTPAGVPKEGDLVIWGGTYGHIAIFIEGNSNRFTSFDENYPTGSPCHVQEHTYYRILGWLRPKNPAIIAQPIANSTNPLNITSITIMNDQTIIDLGRFGKLEIQAIRGKLSDLELVNKLLGERNATIADLTKKLATLTALNALETPQDETSLPPGLTFQLAPILQAIVDWFKKNFR